MSEACFSQEKTRGGASGGVLPWCRSAFYMSQDGFRVNIESQLFGDNRLRTLTRIIRSAFGDLDKNDMAELVALGMLVKLWRESQAEFATFSSEDQIDIWVTSKATMLLSRAGFIKEEGGVYEILGNASQIEAIKIWYEARCKGGRNSAASRAEKRLKNEHEVKNLNDFSTAVELDLNKTSTKPQLNPTQLQLQVQLQDQIKKEKSKKEKVTSTTPTPDGAGHLAILSEPKKAPKPKCYKFEHSDLALALEWIAETHKLHPHIKMKTDVCADAIRKTREHTGRTEEQMGNIAQWIWKDDFWSKNCLSPAALLSTSKNGLKKIDNILASISKDKSVVNQRQLEDWFAGDEEPF